MIWPMATSQMNDSKNANIGASRFSPLAAKISLRVPIDWSMIRKKKISSGSTIYMKVGWSKNREK